MLKYLVLFALYANCGIWAKPVHSDLASHLVIVTPQAQVHLEPVAKYGAGTTFIHHLSPLARIAAPHDETIVYVPASAAAPVIPIEALTQHIGRSSGSEQLQLALPQTKQDSQVAQIQQVFEQAQSAAAGAQAAAQEGFEQLSEQFAEAAASFSPAAFFPPAGGSSSSSSSSSNLKKDEKLLEKIETPANTQPLLQASGRHYYAIASPVIPRIVDFVHGAPVLVGPVSAIRARSLQDASSVPVVAVPLAAEESKPEALALKTDISQENAADSAAAGEREKASEQGRFLEANALKDEIKQEKLEDPKENLQLRQDDQIAAASSQTDLAQPQLKSVVGVVGGGGGGSGSGIGSESGQAQVPVADAGDDGVVYQAKVV